MKRTWLSMMFVTVVTAVLCAPARADHHTFHVTNNASERITGLTMVYHLSDGTTIERAYKVSIPKRVIKDIAIPHSVATSSGPTDTSAVCTVDLAIGYANDTSVWLTGHDLCASQNVEARDSSAYAWTEARLATPIPDLTPEPTAVPPTPQPQATPRTVAQEALHRGEQLFSAGDFAAALPYFNRAIKLDPRNQLAYAYRSRTYFLLNRLQPSLDDADAGLRLNVQYPLLHWIRGNTEFAAHLYDSAIEDYVVTAASQPAVKPYLTVLSAVAAREGGDSARSTVLLSTCPDSCSSDVATQRLLNYLQGKVTARDLLNTASTTYQRSDAHALIGFVLFERGRKIEARAHYKWILQHATPVDNWRPIVRARMGADASAAPRPRSGAK